MLSAALHTAKNGIEKRYSCIKLIEFGTKACSLEKWISLITP